MLERYCGFLHFTNMKGDVLAEKRGGSEDKQLIEAYKNVYNNGTQFRSQGFFQGVLSSKELKIKSKILNIAGLQIADILAYPLKQEILIENKRIIDLPKEDIFGKRICDIVQSKYNRHIYEGRIYGYGKIFLK
jgi:hypothetical protein